MADFRAIYDARFNAGGTDLAERIKAACAYVAQAMHWAVVANASIAAVLAQGGEVADSDIEYVVSVSAATFGAAL